MKKTILLLFIVILIIACKNETKTLNSNNGESIDSVERKTFFEFYFPDTLYVNKTYRGLILYKSDLDTLTTTVLKRGDTMRLLSFHVKHNEKQIKDDFQHILDNKKSELFPAVSKDTIRFEYTFNKTGIYFLEGVLEDEVIFTTLDEEEPLRTITKYKHVIFPVFVTDNENIIDNYGSFLRKNDDEESTLLFYKRE